jgi:hypothetical protein
MVMNAMKPLSYRTARRISTTATQAKYGVRLLAKFAAHNVKSVGVGAKDFARNIKHGLKDGWNADLPDAEHPADTL